jgi:hypothetical protein
MQEAPYNGKSFILFIFILFLVIFRAAQKENLLPIQLSSSTSPMVRTMPTPTPTAEMGEQTHACSPYIRFAYLCSSIRMYASPINGSQSKCTDLIHSA